jgi:hypothetical protein
MFKTWWKITDTAGHREVISRAGRRPDAEKKREGSISLSINKYILGKARPTQCSWNIEMV